jgi:glycosyltransferase involved in cell wall biosynthesis
MIAVSDFVRDSLVGSGAVSERVHVIPNGIELEAFAARSDVAGGARAELGLSPDALVVGSVGRLAEVKGQNYLLEAIAKLPRSLPVVCLLVGDGPRRAHLETIASHLRIEDRVRFLGYRNDIPIVMSALDVLVVSSEIPEAHSLTAIEALAAGKPVVGFDAGGLREVVAHGVTGLLVPPGDADALSQAIREILSAPDRGQEMGRAGARSVDRYGLGQMAEATEALYLRMLRWRRGARRQLGAA